MEKLQKELIQLMEQADIYRGVHTKVYKLKIFSSDYLRKVKRGEQNFDDSEPNKLKVKALKRAYKKYTPRPVAN